VSASPSAGPAASNGASLTGSSLADASAAEIWLAYNDAENAHDLTRTSALVAADLTVRVNGNPAVGSAADDEAAMAALLSVFPDYRRSVEEVLDLGRRAVVRWRMLGQAADGTGLDVAGCSIIATDGGLITDAELYYSAAALDTALATVAAAR